MIKTKTNQKDPPNVLLMRRVSVRTFGGKKVALYKIDQLNQYITVPYNESTWTIKGK